MDWKRIPYRDKHIDHLKEAVASLRVVVSRGDCSLIEQRYLAETIERLSAILASVEP